MGENFRHRARISLKEPPELVEVDIHSNISDLDFSRGLIEAIQQARIGLKVIYYAGTTKKVPLKRLKCLHALRDTILDSFIEVHSGIV